MVVVLTPVETHYELIKKALLAGKHVYTEKTITNDPEKAAEFRKGRVFVTDTDYSDADEIMRLDKEFEESGIDLSPYIGRNKWRGSYSLQFGEVRYAEIFLSRRGEWKNVKTVSYREARDFLSKGEPLPQDADTFSLPDGTV